MKLLINLIVYYRDFSALKVGNLYNSTALERILKGTQAFFYFGPYLINFKPKLTG